MASADAPGVARSNGSSGTVQSVHRLRIRYPIDCSHRTGGAERLRAPAIEASQLPVGREYVPHAVLQAWHPARLVRRNRFDIIQTYHHKADTCGALIAWISGPRHLVSSTRDTGELRKPWHVFANRRLRRARTGARHYVRPGSTAALGRASRSRAEANVSLANMWARRPAPHLALCKPRLVAP
jgi:hypothetical protein